MKDVTIGGMSNVNPEFIERYQLEYEKNPQSRVFAPLAEAYRKMGLLDEAQRICRRGLQLHPDFAGGRVAYAKILLDLKAHDEALTHLEKAIQISPDNLLAHSLLGEALIEMRRPKEALKAFKMVLFLNPGDEKAQAAVKKWEFLTADEFDEDVFAMKPIFHPETEKLLPQRGSTGSDAASPKSVPPRALERAVSLADAYTVRNDLDAAIEILREANQALGPQPEIQRRLKLLTRRIQSSPDSDEDSPLALQSSSENTSFIEKNRRRQILETLLQRINERRLGG